ncbi:class I SAM-dependent methyltransferase [Streptomyces sp. NPDC088729]|uniref:class I SAM-dependent methyltransferase n=1 Tax=Streptomyces sp. NPDC088729 TaxID=3365876 RepID=UPI0037F17B86
MTHHHAPAPHGSPTHTHTHTASHRHGPGHGPDGGSPAAPGPDGLAELLDLDAALFASSLDSALRSIAELAGDGGVADVVDLGAGTGTGTFALLERFPAARVTAVDSSAAMLERLAATAATRNLTPRVHTLEADAGSGLPGVSGVDLVWASASLHHMDDPAAALDVVRGALRPGGLLAVAELDGMPRFLSDDGDGGDAAAAAAAAPGQPGLEDRCRDALTALHGEQVPHLDSDWGALLASAGLTVEVERTERLRLTSPPHSGAGRYAYLVLSRTRDALAGRIDAADLAALDALLDGGPQDVRHRDDLVVRSTRRLWIARRAGQRTHRE